MPFQRPDNSRQLEHHERAMEYHSGKVEEALDSDGFLLANVISYLYHQGMASYHSYRSVMLEPFPTIRSRH